MSPTRTGNPVAAVSSQRSHSPLARWVTARHPQPPPPPLPAEGYPTLPLQRAPRSHVENSQPFSNLGLASQPHLSSASAICRMPRRQRGGPAEPPAEKRARAAADAADAADAAAQMPTGGSSAVQGVVPVSDAPIDAAPMAAVSASSSRRELSPPFVPSPLLAAALPSLRKELLYSYCDPITGKASCLFLSPWSTLADRVAQFMRVFRAMFRLIARSSHAARSVLCSLSLRHHKHPSVSARSLMGCSSIVHDQSFFPSALALCGQDTEDTAPRDEDFGVWAAWLPFVKQGKKWARYIEKELHNNEAYFDAIGNEALSDMTLGKHLPRLLRVPSTPVVVHTIGATMAARLRMLSAVTTFIAIRATSVPAHRQNAAQGFRMAGVIVARVYGRYLAATQDRAIQLFDSSLQKLRQAQKRRTTYRLANISGVFTELSNGSFSHLQTRMLRDGDTLCSRFVNTDGKTPLHYCAIFDNEPLAEVIVAAFADVNARDKLGFSPFSYAAMYDRELLARLLVHAGADIDAAGYNGWSPLHFAAKKGSLKIVELLIDAGANVHARAEDGSLPLHTAAEFKRPAIVRALVAAGAAVNDADCLGRRALHIACCWSGTKSPNPVSCLQVVKALLAGGASVNEKDAKGCSALHHAVDGEFASLDMVKALVAARADLGMNNARGKSPLQCADSNPFCANIAAYLRRAHRPTAERAALSDA